MCIIIMSCQMLPTYVTRNDIDIWGNEYLSHSLASSVFVLTAELTKLSKSASELRHTTHEYVCKRDYDAEGEMKLYLVLLQVPMKTRATVDTKGQQVLFMHLPDVPRMFVEYKKSPP